MYQETFNEFPDISMYDNNNNPTIYSPNSPIHLPFYQDKETLSDIDSYKRFLDNTVARFRKSRTYTNYKAYLMGDLGLDHCQFFGNINSDVASIEMNHVILTVFDDAMIMCEHTINTIGRISSFDLEYMLKDAHKRNLIPIVMMCTTVHQEYHDDPNFYVAPNQIFGKWWEFLDCYKYGITQEIAIKLIYYIRKALEEPDSDDNGLLKLRDSIMDWSRFNYDNFGI